MIYLLLTGEGITYPYVKEQLRSTFSNTSFPFPITDEIAAEFGCFPVSTIELPTHDPRTQRVVEGDPEQVEDGTWRQVLTVRSATQEEIDLYDLSNTPPPDWNGFYHTVMEDSTVGSLMGQILSQYPAVYGGLIVGLGQAAQGSSDLFTTTVNLALENNIIDGTSIELLQSIADTYNVPLQLPQV